MKRFVHLLLLVAFVLSASILLAAPASETSTMSSEPASNLSLNELRARAESGDAGAQFSLAFKYAHGDGVLRDASEAIKWYRKGADQNSAPAEYNLGRMYQNGNGVPKDSAEAVKWYRKAADQNLAHAQNNLGTMYKDGDGVPRDGVEAVKWFRKAAQQGLATSEANLAGMYLAGDGVPKDGTEAVKWLRKAARKGLIRAQKNLGLMYVYGLGVPKNYTEAAKWCRKAGENGDADAQFKLGTLYENGDGVQQDRNEARQWFFKAAIQGNGRAQFALSAVYMDGLGVEKDGIESLAWAFIAAASGEEKAAGIIDYMEQDVLGPDAVTKAKERSQEISSEIQTNKTRNADEDTLSAAEDADREGPESSGSGSIVSPQGYVLTAAHVVADADSINVVTSQGTVSATILNVDEANDLAVLKIAGGPYVPLKIAASRTVRLGQAVATIGFPNIEIQGFSPKVTRGEISSLKGVSDDPRSWQVSAPVQPGNSGGPLLDENGNLIGVVQAKLGLKAAEVTGDMPQNVNYAVKSAYALALLEPYLGDSASEPNQSSLKPSFEDMVAKAQQSVVLILVY